MRSCFAAIPLLLAIAVSAQAAEPQKSVINPPPSAQDWADLAKLPDWSGVWNPKITDQGAQIRTNMPPWTPKVAAQIAFMLAEDAAGRPPPIFVDCLPEAMPSWMLVTHNVMEFLFTPGRVTMLGESDGGRLRRIYTDGRSHPEDPDPTFHGHSIGLWEGDTLAVDTLGVMPQVYIAISEAAGIPNNGARKRAARRIASADLSPWIELLIRNSGDRVLVGLFFGLLLLGTLLVLLILLGLRHRRCPTAHPTRLGKSRRCGYRQQGRRHRHHHEPHSTSP